MKRTVTTVGDLTVKHLEMAIRIPNLHRPGEDFDAPRVAITGKLWGIQASAGGVRLDVRRSRWDSLLIDTPLPAIHPCFLVAEGPPPPPAPVAVTLDGMEH